MAAPYALLGFLPSKASVLPWVIERVSPHIRDLVERHSGDIAGVVQSKLRRLGDLVIWEGDAGRQIVAAVENLSESQQRIEAAISGIESVQHSMQASLSVVQSLSMAALGINSFSSAFLLLRFRALNARLDRLSKRIADIEARLDARDRGLLDSGLNYLHEYEQRRRASDLDRALEKARDSANTYGNLVDDECEGKKRLPVLNYQGRRYLLALTTELQCSLLREDAHEAGQRVTNQKERLKKLVATTYQQTLGTDPEQYLHPALRDSGVTLDLLTDLYQQLNNAGVLSDIAIRDAGDLFEHLRARIYRRPWLRMLSPGFGQWHKPLLEKLRYLIASVEDVNRIESLRLLIADAQRQAFSIAQLREQIQRWAREATDSRDASLREGFLAYRFV